MLFRSLAAAAFAASLALTFATPVQALDKRFTDADGDMVADAPKDPKQWVDPPVLIFSYTPVEDPAVYAKVWDGFVKHLENVTGKKVQFFPVQSNAAQLEAMRAGRLHVSGFNTGSNPLAVNCAGFVPFAMMASLDNAYGYEMEIITFPGSGVTKVEDIKGRKMAFTAQTSNSGFKAPSALLKQKFGLEAGKDYEPVFSGKHDNSIVGVANKDYPAAAIANSVMLRMMARGVVNKDQIVSIYKSQTFPTTGYGYVYNLKPELAEKVKEAFFSFPWDGSELQKEFGSAEPPQQKFMPITYKEHWQVVRDIDAAMGVKYDCKG
ncbi:phosphate/phosphite/phosphonate ABC transporter substrate-binding protein [Pseudorhodoplanes sp.]|uniref:phosphate/phosphite/phosphonate ABC transporter substrate-binding protein n=1 Tax=Pseudorhodoplanes sp. TaxID=1934341 RepID=UPI00391DDF06